MRIRHLRCPALACAATLLAAPLAAQQQTVATTSAPAATPVAMSAWDQVARPGGKLPQAVQIQLVQVAAGLFDPVSVAAPRDGSGRVFVVERQGRVRVVGKDGKLVPEPFLDLTGAALPLGGEVQHQFLEQGLYSVAFHPKYAENGYFYVHYSSLPFNGDGFVVRYKVSKDPNKADPASAKVIYQSDRPYYNHNGGQIAFGRDGYLYIGSGDGGWEGDPLNAGQSLDTDLGKILRVDVDKEADVTRAYQIPATNPLVFKPQLMVLFGVTDNEFARLHPNARPEIWAYGLRNPWSFQFDNKTGDLYIAEVGQSEAEAILFQPAASKGGENYGWKHRLGTKCFPKGSTDCPKFGVPPAAEYTHDVGCAVMGFGVNRSTAYAKLDGTYFFGDWCAGTVWGLQRAADGKWQMEEVLKTGLNFTGGGMDEAGAVYAVNCYCQYTTDKGARGNPPGELWKVVPSDQVPPKAVTAKVKTTK